MKLGIIDNGTDCLPQLEHLCQESSYDFDVVTPQSASTVMASGRYDIAVLTGGLWYDDPGGWYRHYGQELESITSAKIPLLGVCLGMQLIALAFGVEISSLTRRIQGDRTINLTPLGENDLGWPHQMQVYENHSKGIMRAPSDFEVLAHSDECLEIIHHTARPIAGVQFHPQLSEDYNSLSMWRSLIKNLLK